jgi:hypothetical protein
LETNLKRKILISLALLSFIVVALSAVPVQATNGTDTYVFGICLDGSASIGGSDFQIMLDGVADGIRNNIPHTGIVTLCVIQFGLSAQVEIPPTLIDSDATAEAVATAVQLIIYLNDGWTNIADGLWLTWDAMKTAPEFVSSTKQIINLATDGYPNYQLSLALGTTGDPATDATMVVGWAVAEGMDELDAEAIGSGADVAWLRDNIVYPQPGYEAPPFAGPGWVRYVADFQEFAATIDEKFEEIIPPEEHDVSADAQIASATEIMPGDIVDIEVTVTNNGQYTETFDLTCYYDSVEIGTILVVDLAPGEIRVVTFTWDTTGVPLNGYLIKAWADSGEVIPEVDEANNECTMPLKIFVVPELPLGTVLATLSMFIALVGYVSFKRYRTK